MLRGTVASPYVLGSVALQAWPMVLVEPPAPPRNGTLTEARWDFEASNPWMPRFTASGLVGQGTEVSGIRVVCEGTRRGFLERALPGTPPPSPAAPASPAAGPPIGPAPTAIPAPPPALMPGEQVPVFVQFDD